MTEKLLSGSACGRIRVGIAGWKYAPWRGTFYPKGVIQKRELEFASRALPCIEINSTFYRLQSPKTYSNWYAETPDDFMFSVKAPKLITHERRLHDIENPIANFFASGLLNLKEKLGPILWQFPPSFRFDPTLFEDFLAILPHDTQAASIIAKEHDESMNGRSALSIEKKQSLRHVVEIRNQSFVDPQFIDLLRRYRIALVVADTGKRWPEFEDACTDIMYLRLHGDAELYASGYTEQALDRWAQRMNAWAAGSAPNDAQLISNEPAPAYRQRDIFCYFDNTVKEKAPLNAIRLMEKLGIVRINDFVLKERVT